MNRDITKQMEQEIKPYIMYLKQKWNDKYIP